MGNYKLCVLYETLCDPCGKMDLTTKNTGIYTELTIKIGK